MKNKCLFKFSFKLYDFFSKHNSYITLLLCCAIVIHMNTYKNQGSTLDWYASGTIAKHCTQKVHSVLCFLLPRYAMMMIYKCTVWQKRGICNGMLLCTMYNEKHTFFCWYIKKDSKINIFFLVTALYHGYVWCLWLCLLQNSTIEKILIATLIILIFSVMNGILFLFVCGLRKYDSQHFRNFVK